MDFTPDAGIRRRDSGRINAKVEECGADPPAANGNEDAVEWCPAWPLKTTHERAVEEHQICHGRRERTRPKQGGLPSSQTTAIRGVLFTGGPWPRLPGPAARKRPRARRTTGRLSCPYRRAG